MTTSHGRHARSDDLQAHIGLFNVKFSPNLGDGLLSECLELELMRQQPSLTVTTYDLAGRSDYKPGSRFRGAALAVLESSPDIVRKSAVEFILGRALRRRMRPAWRHAMAQLDAVVVGGGNLFGDADLNFPLKINAALQEASLAQVPAAVFGVGVSDNWSPRGETLFRQALSAVSLVYASARDETSAAVWRRRLGPAGIQPARVVRDPGLLVSDHVPQQRSSGAGDPLVALGIAHPTLLRYHADENSASEREMTGWLRALVSACLRRGWRVALFTNGSSEDEDYRKQIAPALMNGAGGKVWSVPRFTQPSELASFISGADVMMAHRLHANIAAFSYGVPHIGFSWDRKLKAFFEGVERSRYVRTAGQDNAEDVAELAAAAMREGIDPIRRSGVIARARQDVADLREALVAALGHPQVEVPHSARAKR